VPRRAQASKKNQADGEGMRSGVDRLVTKKEDWYTRKGKKTEPGLQGPKLVREFG